MSRMAIFPHIDRSFFFLFVSKCILRSISANCFLPNGTDVNLQTQEKNSYQPCNATAEFSMCCKLNAVDNASCHDGLCLSHDTLALWRGPCTDRTWQSSSCLKLCTTGTGKQNLEFHIHCIFFQDHDNWQRCSSRFSRSVAEWLLWEAHDLSWRREFLLRKRKQRLLRKTSRIVD